VKESAQIAFFAMRSRPVVIDHLKSSFSELSPL